MNYLLVVNNGRYLRTLKKRRRRKENEKENYPLIRNNTNSQHGVAAVPLLHPVVQSRRSARSDFANTSGEHDHIFDGIE
jgi:hypothetical protein